MNVQRFEELTDSALISRIAIGEEEAVAPLVQRYQGPLLALLVRLTQSREEAEDLFQETWMRVIRAARSFDPALAFRPWLFSIAWNLAKSSLQRSRPSETLDELADLAHAPTQSDDVLTGERNRRIRSIVSDLPPHLAETMFLRFFEELSEREVASRLGIPVGTVKSRVHNALKQLAVQLRKDFA